MPVAAVTAWVRGLLDGLAMPGPGALAMAAYVTPPDPNTQTEMATAYVWFPDGRESRNPAQGGAVPRNTGPGTAAGWKPIAHVIDVYLVWFQADDDPQADLAFPGIIDAVMLALRTSPDPATLADPYDPNITSTLYGLGEDMRYQATLSALADQAYNRYDALIQCPCTELIQA